MEAPCDIWKPFALLVDILLALALLLGFALGAAAQPVRKPAAQWATLDWLRARLSIREATRYPGNDGPEVAALIRAGGGDPTKKPEYCGFTQTADQKAHGLPYPARGMQGAARAWFDPASPRTFYLAGRRGNLADIAPGDEVGFAWPPNPTVHHISRAEQVVPPLRKGRPPRGYYCLGGNEGRWPAPHFLRWPQHKRRRPVGLRMRTLLAARAADGPRGPRPAPYQPTPADVTLTAAGLPSVGKLVFKGPVTIQVAGPGATQTSSQADNRTAGQHQGSAATAPGATSANASKRSAGPPLAVYLVGGPLLVLAGAGGWEWLSHRGLLAWRVGAG